MVRVLVVDDRPDVRLSLLYMLQASGFEVTEAANGRAALLTLLTRHVDVVLTDLSMPDMNGISLIHAIRERSVRPPRIIAMTGSDHVYGDAATVAAGSGADKVLSKPFNREQLVVAIQDGAHRRAP